MWTIIHTTMQQSILNAVFDCDLTQKPKPLTHHWEHCVGSGHATLALRADWQWALTRCNKELGFKYVRFHGILSDDMGTLTNQMNTLIYSFFNTDQIMDFLVSIGMKPFVELSFMPNTLSSGGDIVFHYKGNITPPKDYAQWAIFIQKLVQHWVERYGIDEVQQWFFEVWNEPNLDAFWTGSQEEYFKLYTYTARSIKGVKETLKVGGPATASNAWIKEFIAYCIHENVPFDFVSTHHYPTDAFGQPGDDTITQLAKSERSVLQKQALQVKKDVGEKPLYYTEWSTSSNPFDELHDMPYAAAFIIKTVLEAEGIVAGYSYWTFSDIFEENYFSSIPFHGGFGLMNTYGIPKPAYRAYQLLYGLGTTIFSVQGKHKTIDVWVTKQEEKKLIIIITNSALPRHEIKTEQVNLKLKGLNNIENSYAERIDDEHANAHQRWKEMGSPQTLSKQDVATLEQASTLIKEPLSIQQKNSETILSISVPPQGCVSITIELL